MFFIKRIPCRGFLQVTVLVTSHHDKFLLMPLHRKHRCAPVNANEVRLNLSLSIIFQIKQSIDAAGLVELVTSGSHLQSSSFSLSFQDVALEILWGAQRSDNWTTSCTVQNAFLCELHHVVLKLGSGHLQKKTTCKQNGSAIAEMDAHLVVHGHINVDIISWGSRKWAALQLQLLQTSCCF